MHKKKSTNGRSVSSSGEEETPRDATSGFSENDSFTPGGNRSGGGGTYKKEDFDSTGKASQTDGRGPDTSGVTRDDEQASGKPSGDQTGESAGDDQHKAAGTTDDTPGSDAGEQAGSEPDSAETDREQELEAEVSRLKEELASAKDSVLRKAAEFENLKRRTQKEKTHLFEDARADAVSKFLPIREDLKRSLEAAEKQNVDDGFLEGLRLMLSNFDRVLEQYNVQPIEKTGVPFNVDEHDAMLSQPVDDDSVESNSVIQVLEPGYKIGERVIKHAKVIVSQ